MCWRRNPTDVANAEEYDGSSWTESGDLSTARDQLQGTSGGSQTASMVFGGDAGGSLSNATEGYDGTVWSTRPSMATARSWSAGAGISTAALIAGGYDGGYSAATEEFTAATTAETASTIDFD